MRAIKEILSGYAPQEAEADMDDSASSPSLLAAGSFVNDDGYPLVMFPEKQRRMIADCKKAARGLTVKPTHSQCSIRQCRIPKGKMHQLVDRTMHASPGSQPHMVVGVRGGEHPSKGLFVVDSGAGLTIMTEKVAEVHCLKIKKAGKPGTYLTASGMEVQLLGTVDFAA